MKEPRGPAPTRAQMVPFLPHALDYGKPMSPKYCLHNWFSEGMPEFTGATEENQIRALNRYVAHGLKPGYLVGGRGLVSLPWRLDAYRHLDVG